MDNTQTQMKLTPLMEASIAITRRVIADFGGKEEAELYDGIIDAFKSEIPQPIKLDLAQGQIVDCTPDLDSYKRSLMAIVQDTLNEDPFSEVKNPEEAMHYLVKELRVSRNIGNSRSDEINKMQLTIIHAWEEAMVEELPEDSGYSAQKLLSDIVAKVKSEPTPEEAKGPAPVVKKVDGRKKPAGDEHLSDLAKLFNQKGVPGLGDLKTHLPRVARHLFGDGITSTVSIAKMVGVSMSDAAAIVKVAQACKDASGAASSEEFMAALAEVTE